MFVRANTPVSFPVLFSSGFPDANVSWKVLGPNGGELASGNVTPPADAVSVIIAVAAQHTALGDGELQSYRDVIWSYTTGGATVYDEKRLQIEARLPFGVSTDGVRRKLGVDATDLPDSEVGLVDAYYEFEEIVSSSVLAAAALQNGRTPLVLRDAIEALAALKLLPTMVVRIANKESSGTNQYQRQKIDWSEIQLALEAEIGQAQSLLLPGFDIAANFGPLLILATPETDPFPGA